METELNSFHIVGHWLMTSILMPVLWPSSDPYGIDIVVAIHIL